MYTFLLNWRKMKRKNQDVNRITSTNLVANVSEITSGVSRFVCQPVYVTKELVLSLIEPLKRWG